MTHPIWLLNSSLLLLSVILSGFLYLMYSPIPTREALEPARVSSTAPKSTTSQVNIRKIYEQDLFNTYREVARPGQATPFLTQAPRPPEPTMVKIPEIPEIQFLAPLDITLKGIIVFSNNPDKNRIIIENNKTKEEKALHLSDTIEDAIIIRILPNKVIFLRSNGQQEILYVREWDAKTDPTFTTVVQWEDIIKQTAPSIYSINATAFAERVNNLSQFIDMLGLTTAYKKGMSVGCKIGVMDQQSFGPKIGLKEDDIIMRIADMPTEKTEDRMNIYKMVSSMNLPKTITVDIIRNNIPMVITYVVSDDMRIAKKNVSSIPSLKPDTTTPESVQGIKESAKEFQKKEKAIMLQQGARVGHRASPLNQTTTE